MIDRIKQVMNYKQMSISAFADNINVNRSSMTHIFNGRNQPSLDIAKKILTAFPDIRTEWLIMGVGEMLQPVSDSQAQTASESKSKVTTAIVDNMRQTELFGDEDFEESTLEDELETKTEADAENETDGAKTSVDAVAAPTPTPTPAVPAAVTTPAVTSTASAAKSRRSSESHNSTKELKRDRISNSQPDRKLVKIVFFYDDRSFEEYFPA